MIALLLVVACVPADPPVRSLVDVPPVPPRDLPFQTEGEMFEAVVDALVGEGLTPAQVATLWSSETVLWSESEGQTVIMRRFLADPQAARSHLDELATALTGAPLPLEGWSEADVWAAYQAASLAAMAYEIGQVAAREIGSAGQGDPRHAERRALLLEGAVLHQLAARGRVPATWPGAWARLSCAFADAFPAEVVAAIPTDPAAADALFRDHYPRSMFEPVSDDTATRAALAMAARARCELARGQPASIGSALESFAPDPDETRALVAEGLRTPAVLALGLTWVELDLGLSGQSARGWRVELEVDEARDAVGAVLALPVALPAGARLRALELTNRLNQALAGQGRSAFLMEGQLVLRAAPRGVADAFASAALTRELAAIGDAAAERFAQAATGALPIEEAAESIANATPPEDAEAP